MTPSRYGPLKRGNEREDGYIFRSYRKDGSVQWLSPEAYHRDKIYDALKGAQRRAKDKSLPCDLSVVFLASIFPSDGRCPALGIDLSWGDAEGRTNSPALDRIVPDLGYTRANVIWVSSLANWIKSCGSIEQIGSVYNFYKDL